MRCRLEAVPRGAYQITPVFVARAEGAVLEDVDGNRLLDFAGGLGCLNVGHRASRVVRSVQAQLDRFLFNTVLDYLSAKEEVQVVGQTTANRQVQVQTA